jgi:N-glycosylase/DNA lyase
VAAKEEKKSKNKILEEKLFYKKESAWTDFEDTEHKKIFSFCEHYKKFIGESRTERLCINNIIAILEKVKRLSHLLQVKTLKASA